MHRLSGTINASVCVNAKPGACGVGLISIAVSINVERRSRSVGVGHDAGLEKMFVGQLQFDAPVVLGFVSADEGVGAPVENFYSSA